MLAIIWGLGWMVLRGVLPYPDLGRRIRVRHAAFRLITCEPWPGDSATGADAAQLALLRVLALQAETRRAVRSRSAESAALLARAALEAYILGAYCLYAENSLTALEAADNRALRRALTYLTDGDLVSETAIKDAADVLGSPGRDLNLADAALELDRKHGLGSPLSLYRRFYMPLSHFYAHPSAFTLMRHVRRGCVVKHHPARAWARRAPVRLADACTGFLAAVIAEKAGIPASRFTAYAEAHIARAFTPVGTVAGRGLAEAADWHRLPQAISVLAGLRRYTHGPALEDDRGTREARIRSDFERAFGVLRLDLPHGAFRAPIEDFVRKILDSLDEEQEGEAPPETAAST